MEKVNRKINSLTDEFSLCYDHDEYEEAVLYSVGEEAGLTKATFDIAKRMLDSKESIDKIIKYTDLTKEEIENLGKIKNS